MNVDNLATAQIFQPDERLTEVIRHVYCMRQPANVPAQQRQLFPNYEVMLVFNFGPILTVSVADHTSVVGRVAVLGPLDRVLAYELPPGADVMVVVFTLNGYYRLVGMPLHALRSETAAHVAASPTDPAFVELWAQLNRMPALTDRVELLMTYTLLRVAPPDADAHSMLDGVNLFNNPAIDPVKTMAETRHLTTRSVQLRLQTNLGFSAKELARFLRFKKVVTQLVDQYPTPPDWTDLVVQHGYHDQSHLIRDFQHYLGLSPTEFVQQLAGGQICITQPGKHY